MKASRIQVHINLSTIDIYWESLTPESAFLARCFSEYLISKDNQAAADEKMPEVSKLAFIVQHLINSYFEAENENVQQELEFTIEQLLIIAGLMDYGDEIGRRQIYGLLRKCNPKLSKHTSEFAKGRY